MKPFDEVAAKEGDRFVHRIYIGIDGKVGSPTRIAKMFVGRRANGSIVFEMDDGELSWAPESELRMLPKTRTVYVNVYQTRLNTVRNHGNCSATFDTEEGARDNARGNGVPIIAIAVPIEIED